MDTAGTILVVGPALLAGASPRRALAAAGFDLLEAPGLGAAESLLLSRRVALVLVDASLPQGDWLALVRFIQQRAGGLPTIVVSSPAGRDELVAGLEAGADLFVSRPISDIVLVARVRALLRRSQHFACTH